jgi:hypothetical protein
MRLFALILPWFLLSCSLKEPGSAFECDCDYLSDTDQNTEQKVFACALNENEANAVARGCQGPGSVESCRCRPVDGPCKSGCAR